MNLEDLHLKKENFFSKSFLINIKFKITKKKGKHNNIKCMDRLKKNNKNIPDKKKGYHIKLKKI